MNEIETIKKVLTLPDLVSISKEDKKFIFVFANGDRIFVTHNDWISPGKLKARFMRHGYIIPLFNSKADRSGFSHFDRFLQFLFDVATLKKN